MKWECTELSYKELKPAVSKLNERLTGILQWVAGETLCPFKEKMLRSGSLLWRQEQKEEATCYQNVVSEIQFHLDLYTKSTMSSWLSEHQRPEKGSVSEYDKC